SRGSRIILNLNMVRVLPFGLQGLMGGQGLLPRQSVVIKSDIILLRFTRKYDLEQILIGRKTDIGSGKIMLKPGLDLFPGRHALIRMTDRYKDRGRFAVEPVMVVQHELLRSQVSLKILDVLFQMLIKRTELV